jgi:FAD dependent oxidoreductase
LCLTQNTSILRPWQKPNDYNSDDWELLRRYIVAANITSFSSLVRNNVIPNAKTDTNNNGPISTGNFLLIYICNFHVLSHLLLIYICKLHWNRPSDFIGESYTWPDASPAVRRGIFARHKAYTQGFFWYLSSDVSVPNGLQSEVNSWGLCSDEWTSYSPKDNWPPQLYIREARRLVGDFVFTQKDREYDWYKNDSIGLFSYNIDSHHVQRYIDPVNYL